MDLWQWVTLDDTEAGTWLAQADVGELVISDSSEMPHGKTLVRFGRELQSGSLVFPLAWGVNKSELENARYSLEETLHQNTDRFWQFNIHFQKDILSHGDVMDKATSSLKSINVLGEMIACIADVVEQIGWNFQSFSKSVKKEGFTLIVSRPEAKVLGDVCRGIVLLKVAIEILSMERGFKLTALKANLSENIDFNVNRELMQKLKNSFF